MLNKIYSTQKVGARPQDTEVQILVKNAYQIFNTLAETTNSNAFEMFGKIMISNGKFSFKMDKVKGRGYSRFVGEAIKIYLNKEEDINE